MVMSPPLPGKYSSLSGGERKKRLISKYRSGDPERSPALTRKEGGRADTATDLRGKALIQLECRRCVQVWAVCAYGGVREIDRNQESYHLSYYQSLSLSYNLVSPLEPDL